MAVDASKHASLAFCLRTEPAIDLRVMHLVRDPRAVAYSWTRPLKRPEAAGAAAASPRYIPTMSPASSAMRWNILNLELHLLTAQGTPTRLMRYEDFIAAPVAGMRELAGFAGVDPELSFMSDTGADLGLTHTAGGNPMRFSAGRIEVRRDDDWRSRLRPDARALVTTLTFPLLARYGYLREPSSMRGMTDGRDKRPHEPANPVAPLERWRKTEHIPAAVRGGWSTVPGRMLACPVEARSCWTHIAGHVHSSCFPRVRELCGALYTSPGPRAAAMRRPGTARAASEPRRQAA